MVKFENVIPVGEHSRLFKGTSLNMSNEFTNYHILVVEQLNKTKYPYFLNMINIKQKIPTGASHRTLDQYLQYELGTICFLTVRWSGNLSFEH